MFQRGGTISDKDSSAIGVPYHCDDSVNRYSPVALQLKGFYLTLGGSLVCSMDVLTAVYVRVQSSRPHALGRAALVDQKSTCFFYSFQQSATLTPRGKDGQR